MKCREGGRVCFQANTVQSMKFMILSILCSQASEFRAQPLPSFHQPPLPSSTKSLTEPAPFNLSTENRGAVKAEKWGQKVKLY